MKKKKYSYKKFLFNALSTAFVIGCLLIFPQFGMKTEAKEHKCVFTWKTLSEGSAYQDLYEIYTCNICGEMEKKNFVRAEDFVKDRLQKQIKGARRRWVLVSELGPFHTVKDELFTWLTERNDIILVVTYEFQGTYYQTTFPAGADYTELLQDDIRFYGLPGLNGRCGIISMAGEKLEGPLSEVVKLKEAEEFYSHIKMAPKHATVYASYGDLYTINRTLLTTLTERNDVTAIIFFEHDGKGYRTTFPAGADYSEILAEGSQFYGVFGLNGRSGIINEIY